MTFSERRLAENEATFRTINIEIKKRMENLLAQAQSDELRLHFYCECSNLKCRERIELLGSEYERIHKSPSNFVIVTGHEQPKVEHVIETHDDYAVVEKFLLPPNS